MKKLAIVLSLLLLLCSCTGRAVGEEDKKDDDDPIDIESIIVEDNQIDDEETEEAEDDADQVDITLLPGGDVGFPYTGPYKPVAVMIENEPKARPQSGIIDADVVYEVHAEGGITRFLALFLSKSPSVVGPVRSVRHYYMHLAQEWDAYLVHYGQSFIAEEQFSKIPVKRLNGIKGSKLFWRDSSRKAPHNVYIDIGTCKDAIDFNQKEREVPITEEVPTKGETYSTITIPYNSTFSKVEYTYDSESGKNMRSTNGTPSTDRESGDQLFAHNIVIQYAKHGILEPGAGYREVELFGSGKAMYFIGGRFFEGRWERQNENSPTRFLDDGGEEIEFIPGNIWVHVVPTNMKVTVE